MGAVRMQEQVVAMEGPDLCGKTTLLEKLRDRPEFRLRPVFRIDLPDAVLSDPEGNEIDEVCRAFSYGMAEVARRGQYFFLDRTYVSAYVYGRVFGRTTDLSWISTVAQTLRPLIVYMEVPFELIVERYRQRGDRMLRNKAENLLLAIWGGYYAWARENPFRDKIVMMAHDTSVEFLVDVIVHRQVRALG